MCDISAKKTMPMISMMTVVMLKAALGARGLRKTGLKADLKQRLLEDLFG